jgi:hypothetical protein
MNRSTVAAGAFGIACIVLIASLVWAVTIINDKNTAISSKDSQISNLQTQAWLNRTDYQNYASSHGVSNSDYNNYVANHHHTDSEYDSLQSIVNLNQQETILNQYTTSQGANTHTIIASVQASYAGYVHISLTSTTSNAYVIVEYWYQGRLFSFQKTLGTSGEAYFCILPASVAIYAGNTNFANGATYTITATYYY